MSIEESLAVLRARVEAAHGDFNDPRKPFRYLVMDDFLPRGFARAMLDEYPGPASTEWCDTTFVHQRRKLTKSEGFSGALAEFFRLTADPRFLALISEITEVDEILDDPALAGGGLHQILEGGFLDVHVDFNLHPETKWHRRLNLLVYLNEGWRQEYGGCLELWDMEREERIEIIEPEFNRAVMFETSSVSYHGHPQPLVAGAPSRKSAAVYYYTEQRDSDLDVAEHNTLYRQTNGLRGYLKTTRSGVQAVIERARRTGLKRLPRTLVTKALQVVTGKGNPNR